MKPGHARNHLVPAKLAAYATPERLAEAEAKRAEWVEDADAAGADDAVDRVRREKTSDAPERARPRSELSRPRPVPTNAVMSDYYFGLEFLKAYPGVYTTVFPWLSERSGGEASVARRVFFPERRDAPNRPRTSELGTR